IAPTVIPKVGSLDDWLASFRLYALALDKQAMAEERLKDFDHQVESLRQSIATGQSATVLRLNPQGPILMSAQVFAGQILASLGFLPNELAVSLKHRPHSDILSLENLTKADADWIFLATLNADGDKALDEVSGQPVFAQLKAVKDGHVVSVDGQVWSSSAGYMAAERILADIAKALAL
ncbi:ABC transporter substrate-binding protein, partial [Pseudomonas sp. HMWF031]